IRILHIHQSYSDLMLGAIDWSENKLHDTLWNMVLESGTVKELYDVDDVRENTMSRGPLEVGPQLIEATKNHISVPMKADDLIADLRIERSGYDWKTGKMKNDDQKDLRKSRDGASGRGLLVLYPISRTSTDSSDTRRPMVEALSAIDPALVSDEPLFGIGIVAPSDTLNVLRDKGDFVAVQPNYTDAEEFEEVIEELPTDDEKDFGGDDVR